jgi:hypothetical protein
VREQGFVTKLAGASVEGEKAAEIVAVNLF